MPRTSTDPHKAAVAHPGSPPEAAALESVTLAIANGPPAEQLIEGLIHCLPPALRTEFSFSTGLRFSSHRPFRVVALTRDPEEQRRVERVYRLPVLTLSGPPPDEFAPTDAWARLIHRVLTSGRVSFLAAELRKPRTDVLRPEDLPALGQQLLEQLDAGEPAGDAGQPPPEPAERPDSDAPTAHTPARQPHAAHPRFQKTAAPEPAARHRPAGPSRGLDLADHAALEKLERLDDLVFDAIAGSAAAMDELKSVWPQLRDELDKDLLGESREQYLRYALAVWDECAGADGVRDPARAVPSLDVLCMLFDVTA